MPQNILIPVMGDELLINYAGGSTLITCHEIFRAKNAFQFKWSSGPQSRSGLGSGFIVFMHKLDGEHKLGVPGEAPDGLPHSEGGGLCSTGVCDGRSGQSPHFRSRTSVSCLYINWLC